MMPSLLGLTLEHGGIASVPRQGLRNPVDPIVTTTMGAFRHTMVSDTSQVAKAQLLQKKSCSLVLKESSKLSNSNPKLCNAHPSAGAASGP